MILIHGANSIGSGGNAYNVIGGRSYRTVIMPDGREWLAENLDFKFDGCDIGAEDYPTNPCAWYYDNNESLYGIDNERHCGLLYNWYAIKYLNDNRASLCPGWHVPTYDEWDYLSYCVQGNRSDWQGGKRLKSLATSWATNWDGTDQYGFSIYPGGDRSSNSFINLGYSAIYYTLTEDGATYAKFLEFRRGVTYILNNNTQKTNALYLRLIRDYQ